MSLNNITINDAVILITAIGIICGFFYKIFSHFNECKENKKEIDKLKEKFKVMECKRAEEKDELIRKIDVTNNAVNLLCNAISALIDNEINEHKDIDRLKTIKEKLDGKMELV